MKKYALVMLVLCVVVVSGCATTRPKLSREEWLSVSSRTYVGVTKDQVLIAAEKLFNLADGDDFQIVHTDDGLYATRNWSIYLVISAVFGTDYWQMQAIQNEDGVKATVRINTQAAPLAPMMTTGSAWTVTSLPMAGAPIDGTAIYDIFWDRMDYLLAKKSEWMTCKDSDEKIKKGIVWGANEALCNSFNMKDTLPYQEILESVPTHEPIYGIQKN